MSRSVRVDLGKVRITPVWSLRCWSFGIGFPHHVWAVLFVGPLIVWLEPSERWQD